VFTCKLRVVPCSIAVPMRIAPAFIPAPQHGAGTDTDSCGWGWFWPCSIKMENKYSAVGQGVSIMQAAGVFRGILHHSLGQYHQVRSSGAEHS
jgi:hypothetical protein